MSIGVKILILLALCAGAVLGYNAWEDHIDQQGYKRANSEWEKKEADIKADAAQKLAAATTDARTKEQALNRLLLTETEKRLMGNANYEKTIAGLNAAVRSRDLRLSVAIDPRSLPRGTSGTDTGTASGHAGETRADVMPETAVDTLRIAGGSAKDVRDFNAVVDAYNAARETCNAGVGNGR